LQKTPRWTQKKTQKGGERDADIVHCRGAVRLRMVRKNRGQKKGFGGGGGAQSEKEGGRSTKDSEGEDFPLARGSTNAPTKKKRGG